MVETVEIGKTGKTGDEHARYDAIAARYHRDLPKSWVHPTTIPALVAMLTRHGQAPRHGIRICDLGCGTGILARELARRGVMVTGLDISEEMLRYARQSEMSERLGITYVLGDACTTILEQPFEVVASNLVMTDVSDLPAFTAAMFRLLRPGGLAIWSMLHPCGPRSRSAEDVEYANYYLEGHQYTANTESVRGQVGTYHRRLETIFSLFLQQGFILKEIQEPRAIHAPMLEYRHAPAFLLACWQKPAQKEDGV